ncbi:MAG: beta-eliminating lyase-related protein [bacterium]|nr:beta-eliminating lyase-related protein [bacterium]
MLRMNCDYLEGCHPQVLAALAATNMEQHPGYGTDAHCEHAACMIREAFACPDAGVHFLTGGTQANMTVIAAALRPFEGVLCADTGHIHTHETGAVEATGHKCLALKGASGKITAAQVEEAVRLQADDEHTVRPGMVYLSMSTELGTLYTLAELQAMHEVCRRFGLLLYVDGARLGYALAAPACDVTPPRLAECCDAFTVGGTKIGALFGEAVVLRDDALNTRFRYSIKQRGGMLAKGRLLGVQFEALMKDGLYWQIGGRAVRQALRIRDALAEKGIGLMVDSPTNQQFPVLTHEQARKLAEQFVLEDNGTVDPKHVCKRICTSWATTDAMVDALLEAICAL